MTDSVTSLLISALRREIEMVLLPELTTSYAKLAARWVCDSLDYMLLDEHRDIEVEVARSRLLQTLPPAQARADLLPDVRDPENTIAAIAASMRAAGPDLGLDRIHASSVVMRTALQREQEFLEARRKQSLERIEVLEVEVTAKRLDQVFAGVPSLAGCRTLAVERMTGGYSKDTFLIEVDAEHGERRGLALRRDLPFGPVEGSAADEFSFLNRLHELGIPVAQPVFAERSAKPLGQPFLLTTRISGVSADRAMDANEAVGKSGARQLARILARLHRLDPRDAGLTVFADEPAAQIKSYLDHWRARWINYRSVESDLMEAAFSWLYTRIPQNVGRNVIIHGDYRPGNAIMLDGTISGIVDWEFIHPGDSSEDLEYVKLFIAPYLRAEEFVAEYLNAGGLESDATSSAFYEVFRSVRNVVCTDIAWHGFLNGYYPSMKLAVQGVWARRLLLSHLAVALERVTGLASQPEPKGV